MARAGIDVITIGKIRHYLSGFDPSDTTQNGQLTSIISMMSAAFERYMRRYLYAVERTEYFDILSVENRIFFPKGTPITAVTGYYDQGRDFDTAMDTDDIFVGEEGMSVEIDDGYLMQEGSKVLKLVYTGGLATSTWNTTAVLSGVTGTFTAGNALYVSTNVKGTVVSWTAATSTLVWTPTVTDSTFDEKTGGLAVGDVVKESGASPTGTIASFSTANLLYDYPDIMAAALAQAGYIFRRKDHAGKTEIQALGERFYTDKASYLCPEAIELLEPYRIRIV